MAVGRQYPLSLLLTAIDRVSAPVARINAQLQRLTTPLRPVQNAFASLRNEAGVSRVAQAWGGVTDAIQDVGAAAQTTLRRITYLGGSALAAAFLFKRQVIDTGAEFENLRVSLEAIEGSADKARRAMAFVRELTVKTPFESGDIARTFRVLRGFGLDPTNGTMQAIVDQVAKLGGSGEQLTHIAMQLGQAFSKGRLQAQDANILVENGIPVWGLLQRAIERTTNGQKVSIAQLREWSEQGRLGVGAIRQLIDEMGRESGGASARMMKTWTGMISNLSDQWTFFKLRVLGIRDGEVLPGGLLDRLKGRVKGFLQWLERKAQSGELDKWADEIGKKLGQAFEWMVQTGPQVWEALRLVGRGLAWVAELTGGWGNLLKMGLAAFIGGPLAVALAGLIAAVATFGTALTLTPIGWFLGALALMAAGAVLLITKWEVVVGFFQRLWQAVTKVFGGIGDTISAFLDGDLTRAIAGVKRLFGGLWEFLKIGFELSPLGWIIKAAGWLADRFVGDAKEGTGESASTPRALPARLARVGLGPPALGAAAGAGLLARPLAAHQSEARITVDFRNTPPGTRIHTDPRSTAAVDLLRRGLSMAESH